MRQQDKADYDSAHHVSHDYLEESEVRIVSKSGDADDGERAGFGGDDGERDGPPGDIAPGEEIVAQRAVAISEAQSEQSDTGEIERDDREIELIQTHVECREISSNHFSRHRSCRIVGFGGAG